LRISQTYRPRGVILVIGACGHVGKETLIALSKDSLSADFQIRAGVRDLEEGIKKVDSFGVDAIECNLKKPESVQKAMQGVSKVFLILPNVEDRLKLCKVAVDAAKSVGVEHFLFLSLLGCEKKSIWIAKQFRECEQYIEASGIPYTHLRTFWFQENLVGLARAITNANELKLSIGKARIPPVSLIDIGDAACNILMGETEKYKNRVYKLTGDELFSGDDIARLMTKVSGKEIIFTSPTKEEMKKVYLDAGYEEWEANSNSEMFEWLSKNEFDFTVDDHKELLQRSSTKLESTLNNHKDHFFVRSMVGILPAK